MMDLESIKVIADTATQLTGEAKQIFIWWLLGKEVLGTVLTFVAGVVVALLAYRILVGVVTKGSAAQYLQTKRNEFGIGSPGYLTGSECEATIKEIERRLKEANK